MKEQSERGEWSDGDHIEFRKACSGDRLPIEFGSRLIDGFDIHQKDDARRILTVPELLDEAVEIVPERGAGTSFCITSCRCSGDNGLVIDPIAKTFMDMLLVENGEGTFRRGENLIGGTTMAIGGNAKFDAVSAIRLVALMFVALFDRGS